MRNVPVPAGPVAPLSIRWAWWIAPPALLTLAYRAIPARIRGWWNPRRTANSHLALAAIVSGGGWRAFAHFAIPHMADGIPWWMDG